MSTTTAVKESEVEQIDHVLGEEYEHVPVPSQARRSLFSVTMVWIGFPMIITGAMTGSVLVLGMGFQRALIAMIIGNLIMFAYVGALGALGTKKGMNFALIASIVFGRKGYVFSSGLLSTLLLGWYAVQTGITGNLISSTYHLNYVLMTIIAGILYIAITFVGVKGLHYIGSSRCRCSSFSAFGSRATPSPITAGRRLCPTRAPTAKAPCRWASD
jgi:cytosine permease